MSHNAVTTPLSAAAQICGDNANVPVLQPYSFDIERVCDQLEQQGFAHTNNLLSEELLKALYGEIKQLDENYALQSAGIGRGEDHLVNKAVRSDKIHWIEGDTFAQCQFQEKLEQIRIDINYRLMLGLFESESNFAVYRKGDFYQKHLDSFKGQKNRILSMVIYLNPEWSESDGGLLNIYKHEESETPFMCVVPTWGTAVLFLSEDVPHEVTPAYKNRYSIATWFRCNCDNLLL